MPEQQRTTDADCNGRSPAPVHKNVRWEERDVSVLGFFLVGAAIGLFGAGLLLVVRLMLWHEEQVLAQRKASGFPLVSQPSGQLPAEPKLEPINRLENVKSSDGFSRYLQQERQLHSYGETSDDGFVHVPIEQAMKIIVDKLPIRELQPSDARSHGLVNAGEANSGRMFREEHH